MSVIRKEQTVEEYYSNINEVLSRKGNQCFRVASLDDIHILHNLDDTQLLQICKSAGNFITACYMIEAKLKIPIKEIKFCEKTRSILVAFDVCPITF